MAATEKNQKKQAYNMDRYQHYHVRLIKGEEDDMIEFINSRETSMNAYFRKLVLADMQNEARNKRKKESSDKIRKAK